MRALFVTDDYQIDPLGIGWLSSYLKAAGHDVDILKWKGLGKVDAVADYHPDMVCYSVTTGKHRFYQQLNKNLREQLGDYWLSVFGGPHVTFFPEFTREPGVDIGVQGEGFDAIVDIANIIDKGGIAADLANVPNIAINGYGNGLRPLKDKSSLLHPDRELIYKYPENRKNPIRSVMCSIGCPYSCSYCYTVAYRKLYGKSTLQIRPVDSIIEEIRVLQNYSLELVWMQDDVFPVYDPAWLRDFCEQYKSVAIPFHIQLRAEYIVPEAIVPLKEVGLHGVTFAIETGSMVLRRDLLGRHMSDSAITRAADLLHKHGVKIRTENMIGIPHETWASVKQTLDLNIKCDPTLAWASLYQPYPATKLGDYCVEEGLFSGDPDDLDTSFFDSCGLKTPNSRKFARVQKLFSIIVRYPCLKNFLYVLCSIPLDNLYKLMYSWYKQRTYSKRLYKL